MSGAMPESKRTATLILRVIQTLTDSKNTTSLMPAQFTRRQRPGFEFLFSRVLALAKEVPARTKPVASPWFPNVKNRNQSCCNLNWNKNALSSRKPDGIK